MQVLGAAGPDQLTAKDNDGNTPLSLAVQAGSVRAVAALMETAACADVLDSPNSQVKQIFHHAGDSKWL